MARLDTSGNRKPKRSETATIEAGVRPQQPTPPLLRVETDAGTFLASTDVPIVSSARKQVFRGAITLASGARVPAVAMLFFERDPAYFAAEVSSLARNQLLCIGPTIYSMTSSLQRGNAIIPVIVEEDAGTNLERAIFSHEPIVGAVPSLDAPLSEPLTPNREKENAKILYDVLDQVERLHANGLYHRDIRAANICVRRYGPLPEDLHATLIDHELVTEYEGQGVPASAERYRKALFCDIPHRVSCNAPSILPTSLMRDLGYLAALQFELSTGTGVEYAGSTDLAVGARPFFQYTEQGAPVVRCLDREEDIDPLAHALGLEPIDVAHYFDIRVVDYALQRIAPGGFIDARGKALLEQAMPLPKETGLERIARNTVYRAWLDMCQRMGRIPEYEDFDEQPELLQESNIDQIRDIPAKVRALGYQISSKEAAGDRRIGAFAPEEIEQFAFLEHRRWCAERMRDGWVAGSPRDDSRRVHPDLIPYDDLSEQSKEYDRSAARLIIDILDAAGLAVVRPL